MFRWLHQIIKVVYQYIRYDEHGKCLCMNIIIIKSVNVRGINEQKLRSSTHTQVQQSIQNTQFWIFAWKTRARDRKIINYLLFQLNIRNCIEGMR